MQTARTMDAISNVINRRCSLPFLLLTMPRRSVVDETLPCIGRVQPNHRQQQYRVDPKPVLMNGLTTSPGFASSDNAKNQGSACCAVDEALSKYQQPLSVI
jgi:hypothetical protein